VENYLLVWSKLTPAETHDAIPVKVDAHLFRQQRIFADKAYDFETVRALLRPQHCEVITPQKTSKKESMMEKQRNLAYRNLLQTAVSSVRQPIESFFNWLNERTNIQNASKVRWTLGAYLRKNGRSSTAYVKVLTIDSHD